MPTKKTSKEEVPKRVIHVLRERGISKSSMSELAKACDIQKFHFYYYFSSKEQLIKEVLATVNSYFRHNFFKIVENNNLSTPQKLTDIRTLINSLFKNANTSCIMANTALETAHLDPIYATEIKHFFSDFIKGIHMLLIPKHSKKEAFLHFTKETTDTYYKDIKESMLLISIDDDLFAPKKSVDILADRVYSNANTTRMHLNPIDYNLKRIGHFDFFKKKNQDILWSVITEWFQL